MECPEPPERKARTAHTGKKTERTLTFSSKPPRFSSCGICLRVKRSPAKRTDPHFSLMFLRRHELPENISVCPVNANGKAIGHEFRILVGSPIDYWSNDTA